MAVPPNVSVVINEEQLRDYLGPPIYHKDRMYTNTMPAGVALGLGYLGNGSGSLMPIETTLMPGKGNLHLTGKLGDVIKESASIALSWVKSHAYELGLTKSRATRCWITATCTCTCPRARLARRVHRQVWRLL